MTTAAAASHSFGVFGTSATLIVLPPGTLGDALAIVEPELAAVDLACNRFRPDSEISVLNGSRGARVEVSPLFAEAIEAALRAARLTGGDVDPACEPDLARLGYDRDFRLIAGGSPVPARGGGTGESPAPVPFRGGGTGEPPAPVPFRGGGTGEPPAPVPFRGGGTGEPPAPRPPRGGGFPRDPLSLAGRPVAAAACRASRASRGWQRIEWDRARAAVRLPKSMRLDLGATAKAWAADRCARMTSERLGCGILVSLGGDIAAAGPAPAGGWRIRVTDAHTASADAPGQTVAISSGGLATSSVTVRVWQRDGARLHHIVHPATGQPASSCWRTVSVAAASCLDANTASTAAIIRSEVAPLWLTGLGLPARLVRRDGSVVRTPGWPRDAAPEAAA